MTARDRSPTIACHERLLGSGPAPPGRHPAARATRPRPGARRLPASGPADRRRGLRRHAHRPRAASAQGSGLGLAPRTAAAFPGGLRGARRGRRRRARRGPGRGRGACRPRAASAPEPGEAAEASRPRAGCTAGLPGGSAAGWAVETHGLTKRFGPNAAVDHVELLVPRGSAFGYLGPNGAGKTTLIRTLLGLTRADAGTMSLLGIRVPAERSQALARVGAIVDEPRFHHHLTGPGEPAPAGAPREAATRRGGSRGRWPGSASPSAPTTRSPRTRWACASAWGSRRACWVTPTC